LISPNFLGDTQKTVHVEKQENRIWSSGALSAIIVTLLFDGNHSCGSRGLLPGEKPELQRVLEQRRLDQHREQEQALRPPSDLEQELRKRQQKMEEVQKRREEQENVPEFVRVKENLRHVPVSQ
uniref:Si:ch211-160o17.6 n=1 Tax=Scleropages formosus TaxID=113540 RepID=A0A8C9R8R3_SCLFO